MVTQRLGRWWKNTGRGSADRTDNRGGGIWNIGLCPPTPSVTTAQSLLAATVTRPSGICSSHKSGKAGQGKKGLREKTILKTFIPTNWPTVVKTTATST